MFAVVGYYRFVIYAYARIHGGSFVPGGPDGGILLPLPVVIEMSGHSYYQAIIEDRERNNRHLSEEVNRLNNIIAERDIEIERYKREQKQLLEWLLEVEEK